MDQDLLIALGIMVAGLIGCIAPVMPGPPLIWLGALFYGWRTGFEVMSWPWLVLLFVIALVGGTADLWLSLLGARKGGASGWSQLAAFFGGLIGLVCFSLPGMIIGAIGAIVAVEWYRHKDWSHVMRAGGGYLAGYLIAMIVELFSAVVIIGIFLVRLGMAGKLAGLLP